MPPSGAPALARTPLRSLLEKIAGDSGLPARDAIPGDGHGVIHTPAGDFGVVISWETFFDGRARDAIGNGGQILMNPTNGALEGKIAALEVTVDAASATMLPTTGSAAETAVLTALAAAASAEPVRIPVSDR